MNLTFDLFTPLFQTAILLLRIDDIVSGSKKGGTEGGGEGGGAPPPSMDQE